MHKLYNTEKEGRCCSRRKVNQVLCMEMWRVVETWILWQSSLGVGGREQGYTSKVDGGEKRGRVRSWSLEILLNKFRYNCQTRVNQVTKQEEEGKECWELETAQQVQKLKVMSVSQARRGGTRTWNLEIVLSLVLTLRWRWTVSHAWRRDRLYSV